MKEGKQFFKLDGPIGRKQFVFTLIFVSIYGAIANITVLALHSYIGVNKYNLVIFLLLWGIYLASIITITWVNYTKRLWDLLGNKSNAIFYASAIWIASIAAAFIPVVRYIWFAIALLISFVLLLIKGKLITGYNDTIEDEE